jgi:hypothetical protein
MLKVNRLSFLPIVFWRTAMKALTIKDLSRNDELTVEEMRASKGGIGAGRLLDETYEPASEDVAFTSNSVSNVFKALGDALSTAARK